MQGGSPLVLEAGRLACGAPYADGGAVSGRGATHILEMDFAAVEFTLTLDTSGLIHGRQYTLCTDLDGYGQELRFGDTELQALVDL